MQIRLTILSLVSLFLLASCSKDGDFTLTGKVNGLKKGKIYLQRIEDTSLVTIDSVIVTN